MSPADQSSRKTLHLVLWQTLVTIIVLISIILAGIDRPDSSFFYNRFTPNSILTPARLAILLPVLVNLAFAWQLIRGKRWAAAAIALSSIAHSVIFAIVVALGYINYAYELFADHRGSGILLSFVTLALAGQLALNNLVTSSCAPDAHRDTDSDHPSGPRGFEPILPGSHPRPVLPIPPDTPQPPPSPPHPS